MSAHQYVDPRDILFWLYEVGGATELTAEPRYADFDRPQIESMLDAAMELAGSGFAELAQRMDEDEPRLEGGRVVLHPDLGPMLKRYIDSGIPSAAFPEDVGGLGMPYSLNMALRLPVDGIGGPTLGYLFLTAAAANMLATVGSEDQKRRYLPALVSMRWFGTMMLSEPQAGSSLGDIRTRAVRQPDGTYHLSGSKMWISAGDHELSENIVHMVLAKIDDGSGVQPGSRGISLFIVPKFLLNADGSPGARNGVFISGLNHKMGNRATVNTVPVLGGATPCVGELVGEPGQGLAAMFHMMNEARIGVGMGAAITGYCGFRYSLGYARERPQGRPLNSSDPASCQVPIIEHADVRRMLLAQKALTEGAVALCLYAAELVDRERLASDVAERQRLSSLLAFLTPMVKTWPSIWCAHANSLAMQVLGGYGYTRDYPLERLYRDNRLNEIHEGTTGIQSLDLLGRKILKDQGRSLRIALDEMQATVAAAREVDGLADHAEALAGACARLASCCQTLGAAAARGELGLSMANSAVLLDMCGHTLVAWMWLRMGLAAEAALRTANEHDIAFYRGKLRACRYFFRWELPRTQTQADLLNSLDDTCLGASADEF